MAGIDQSSEEGEYEFSGAIIRNPGYLDTPDDVREILYRMLSNLYGCDLLRFSSLSKYDDPLSYDEMAKKVADDAFLLVQTEDGTDAHLQHKIYFRSMIIKQSQKTEDFHAFGTEIERYVVGVLKLEIEKTPVKCIKGIYTVVKDAAKFIKQSIVIPEDRKILWFQNLVDSIWIGMERFEERKHRQLKCYIKIWDMDDTMEGGTDNLLPMPPEVPPAIDVPAEGAELVRDMITKIIGHHFLVSRVSEEVRFERKGSFEIISKLVKMDPSQNPITASGAVVALLRRCYKRYNDSKEDNRLEVFKRDVCELLLTKVLTMTKHKFETLAAFLMVIGFFVQSLDDFPEPKENEMFVGIVDASEEALRTANYYLVKTFGENVWINFEGYMWSRV